MLIAPSLCSSGSGGGAGALLVPNPGSRAMMMRKFSGRARSGPELGRTLRFSNRAISRALELARDGHRSRRGNKGAAIGALSPVRA